MTTRPVPYRDDIEVRQPDEDEVIAEIIAAFGRINRTTADRYRHAVRPSHAKSHGLLKGEMRVYDDLPGDLRQGLFAAPGTYPAVLRFASVPGDILADSVTTQRGLAIKVIGIDGEMLPGHDGEATQDFLLDNDPRFPVADAAAFLKTIQGLEKTTEKAEPLKRLVSVTARGGNAVLKAFGMESANLDFFGHPPKHILADSYYSQAPMRYGDYVAKVRVAPASENLRVLAETKIDVGERHSALRDAIAEFFAGNGAEYELAVQLCTDLETMPVEDASAEWSEEVSPYWPVARIIVSSQAAYSPARRVYVDDVLSFSPAHGLAAHRPLGSIMRARLKGYQPSSRFRHEVNVQPRVEPRGIDEIPD